MIIDYIGAGMSPLAYTEYNMLINLGATVRLVPAVYLTSNIPNIRTYNHSRILKDYSNYILQNAFKLKDKINVHEWIDAMVDSLFIKYVNYPRNPWNRVKMIAVAKRLNDLYRLHGRPDVIHVGMMSEMTLLAMYVSKKAYVPFTITLHSSDFMMKAGRRVRYVKKICDEASAVITISNYNKGYLTALGVEPEKLHVIKAGIDTEIFKRKTEYKADNIMLYVGRLIRFKGLEYLIKALAHLKDQHVKFMAKIVGEGPLEGELRELAAKLNVDKYVEFKGFVPSDELTSVYEDASVFVHPSVDLPDGRRDGIPVSMIEAMSMELPVVSTYCSGIPELVEDGWNGLLVDQKNPVALAEAIKYLLENPAVAKEYGRRGREKVVREYNARKNIEKLLNVFRQVSRK